MADSETTAESHPLEFISLVESRITPSESGRLDHRLLDEALNRLDDNEDLTAALEEAVDELFAES